MRLTLVKGNKFFLKEFQVLETAKEKKILCGLLELISQIRDMTYTSKTSSVDFEKSFRYVSLLDFNFGFWAETKYDLKLLGSQKKIQGTNFWHLELYRKND